MRATGIVRRLDDLGRIIIPKEIRRVLTLREGDPLEIYIQDGGVLFKKVDLNGVCVFCGETTERCYKGIYVCSDCAKASCETENLDANEYD